MKLFLLLITVMFSFSLTKDLSASEIIFKRHSHQPCWDEAAQYHGVDPWLLYSIAYVESTHNPSAVSKANNNGTYDIGLMQINSWWLPTLKKHGITETHLKNACVSTYVGAWVLAQNIRMYGYTWEAIAAYNVGNPKTPNRRRIGYGYASKVYRYYDKFSKLNTSSSLSVKELVARNYHPPQTNTSYNSESQIPTSSNDRSVVGFEN